MTYLNTYTSQLFQTWPSPQTDGLSASVQSDDATRGLAPDSGSTQSSDSAAASSSTSQWHTQDLVALQNTYEESRYNAQQRAEDSIQSLKDNSATLERLALRTQDMTKALGILMSEQPEFANSVLGVLHDSSSNRVTFISSAPKADLRTGTADDAAFVDRDGAIFNVETGDGADTVVLRGESVERVRTDSVTSHVTETHFAFGGGIRTAWENEYSNNDTLDIEAELVRDVETGGGDDAIAIRGGVVAEVDAGEGDDHLAIQAGLIRDIATGAGDDVISVEAAAVANRYISQSANSYYAQHLAEAISTTPQQVGQDLRPASFKALITAAANSPAIDAGSGDDQISIVNHGALSVDAGAGDDRLSLSGGATAVRIGADGGNDVITLKDGANLVIQTEEYETGTYTVRQDSDDQMTLTFESGASVTIQGIQDGGDIMLLSGGLSDYSVLHYNPENTPMDVRI